MSEVEKRFPQKLSVAQRLSQKTYELTNLILPVLLAFFLSVLGGLYLLGTFRGRCSGKLPLAKDLLPWVPVHLSEIHVQGVTGFPAFFPAFFY